jgi:hypothetical protein
MPYTDYLKNRWLNCLKNNSGAIATVYASLHTANPGATGTNEVTGGSPAYARKLLTFNAPATGSMALTSSVTFDVPAGTTVAYVGLWDASTAGNFLGYGDPVDEVFAAQGQYVLSGDTLDLNS